MTAHIIKTALAKAFGKHLFITNTAASTVLMGIGDVCQQQIEFRFHNRDKHDWKRTLRMMTMGLVLGPMVHVFYGVLDRYYKITTGKIVLRKILWDQFVASPTFSCTFITGMALLQGKTFKEGLHEFGSKFPTVYAVDWLVWPPTQAINFYFMPPQLRAVYVYFVDVIWYTFNSYIVHKYHPSHNWFPWPPSSDEGTSNAPHEPEVGIDIDLVPIIR